MLKVKINNSNSEIYYEKLTISGITSTVSGDTDYLIIDCYNHKLKDNDIVRLSENVDGNSYTVDRDVVSVIDESQFITEGLPIHQLEIDTVEKLYVDYNLNYIASSGVVDTRLALVMNFTNEHYFTSIRHKYLFKEDIDKHYYDTDVSLLLKRCSGDYLRFNGFVFQSSGVTNGRYILSDNNVNNKNGEVHFSLNNTEYVLRNGYVPINEYNEDVMSSLIFFYDTDSASTYNKVLDLAAKKSETTSFWQIDNRFFETSGDTLALKSDEEGLILSSISKRMGDYRIAIPFGNDFTIDGNRDELMSENYLEDEKAKSVNKVLDYEKQMFVPMFIDYNSFDCDRKNIQFKDSWLKPVQKITFNLHFRKRSNEYDSSGNILKEWVVSDELLWNNYNINSGGDICASEALSSLSPKTNIDSYGDLLSHLNFTDDDVYYQKNKLKKSFIRLSFYDSRDRATQSLQFYSTIFLDSGKMYTKYLNAKNAERGGNNFVSKEQLSSGKIDEGKRLGVQFSCSSKYDMSACSEGFYLYMFPDLIEGNGITPMYMKVEFNHAKYGRIIPMSMPTYSYASAKNSWLFGYKKNTPIPSYSGNTSSLYFPVHYLNVITNGSNNQINGVNMSRLLNDTYIEVYTKYNFETDEYVWFLPRAKDSMNGPKMIFNLFEPRINGTEAVERDIYNGGGDGDDNNPDETDGLNVDTTFYVSNSLGEDNIINMVAKLDTTVLCDKTINLSTKSVEVKTTIQLPNDENETITLNVSTYGCAGSATDYRFVVLNYSGRTLATLHGIMNSQVTSKLELKRNDICFFSTMDNAYKSKIYLTVNKWT